VPGVRESPAGVAADSGDSVRPHQNHARRLKRKRPQAFARLDKELETTVGRKERIVGALRQHVKDHKCSGTEGRDRIEKSRLRSLNKMAGLPKQNARKPLFRFTRIYTAHAFDRGDRTARLCHSAGPTRRLLFAAQRAQAPAIEFK
jgi:hypothetical protein